MPKLNTRTRLAGRQRALARAQKEWFTDKKIPGTASLSAQQPSDPAVGQPKTGVLNAAQNDLFRSLF